MDEAARKRIAQQYEMLLAMQQSAGINDIQRLVANSSYGAFGQPNGLSQASGANQADSVRQTAAAHHAAFNYMMNSAYKTAWSNPDIFLGIKYQTVKKKCVVTYGKYG